MTATPDQRRCPRCRRDVSASDDQCAECGFPFVRLCSCGATCRIFDAACPACGRRRRKSSQPAGPGLLLRAARAFRRSGANRSGRAAPSGGGACPSCTAELGERADACSACGAELAALCRCGARYHRVLDVRCRECGRKLHRRRREKRRRSLAIAAAALTLLLAIGGAAAWVLRDDAGRIAGYYEAGVDALRGGRPASAAEWFARFLEHDPKHAAARFMLGQSLHLAGRTAEGAAEVEAAAALDPALDEPRVFLGRIRMEEGRFAEALAHLERAVAADPKPPEAFLLIGRIHLLEGRTGKAIEALRTGIAGRPKPPPIDAALTLAELVAERAELLGRAADRSEAIRLFQTAIGWLAPDEESEDPERDARLARAWLGLGDHRKAQYRAQQAEQRFGATPRGADMLLAMARALAMQGAAEAAAPLVERALGVDPVPERHLAAARLFRRIGDSVGRRKVLADGAAAFPDHLGIRLVRAEDRAEAGEAAAAAAELASEAERFGDEREFHLTLAWLHRRAGDATAAHAVLAAARQRFPDDAGVRRRELAARIDALARSEAGAEGPEWEAAQAEAEALSRTEPDHPESLAIRGRLLLAEGRPTEALPLFTAAHEADPTDPEAALAAGICEYRAGRFEDAAARLSRVLRRVGSELPEVRLALADSYRRLSLHDAAATAAGEVAASRPRDPAARRLLGLIHLGAGRGDAARREFEVLLSLVPDDLEAHLALAWIHLSAGRVADAERAFAAARRIADDPEEAFHVARVEAEHYRRMERSDLALSVLERFADAHPGRTEARLATADFLLSLGRPDEARAALAAVLASAPGAVGARRRLAELEFGAGGDLAEAERQIGELSRRSPNAPDRLYLAGKLATAKGDAAGGAQLLAEYVDQAPEDPDGQYALGVALHRAGRPDEAIERLELALGRLPGSPVVRRTLGLVLQERAAELTASGRYADAEALVERALRYAPGLGEARLTLATALARMGRLAGSEEAVLELVRREPGNVNALRLLGAVRAASGRPDAAAEAFQRAVELNPDSGYDRYLLASADLAGGDWEAAFREAMRAREGAADPLFAADVIAAALLAGRRAGPAEEFGREIVAARPEDARAHLLLGMVLRRGRKDFDRAREAFARALDMDPQLDAALWEIVVMETAERGDRKKALEEALFRRQESPDDPGRNYVVAWLHATATDGEAALPYLRRAVAVDPAHRPSALLFARILTERGEHEAAREALRPLLERGPDAEALYTLASSHDREGNPELAIRRYREALAADRSFAPAANNLAMHLLSHAESVDEARSFAQRALDERPEEPRYLDTMARVHRAAGNLAESERVFLLALKGFQTRRTELELALANAGRADPAARPRLRAELTATEADLASVREALAALEVARAGGGR